MSDQLEIAPCPRCGSRCDVRYLGGDVWVRVTYVLRGPNFGVPVGYVVMGITRDVVEVESA